jgi:hypothetical protein
LIKTTKHGRNGTVRVTFDRGVIAVPVSVIVHSSVVRAMARAGGTGLPASYINVFTPPNSRSWPWPGCSSGWPAPAPRHLGGPRPHRVRPAGRITGTAKDPADTTRSPVTRPGLTRLAA